MDAEDVQLGEERFYDALGAVHEQPVGGAIDSVLKQVDDYTHETDDDISIRGLEFHEPSSD